MACAVTILGEIDYFEVDEPEQEPPPQAAKEGDE